MTVEDRINQALEAVERIAPPSDLRPSVFSALMAEGAPPSSDREQKGGGRDAGRETPPLPDTILGKLAARLDVDLDAVERIYEAVDDDLRLIVMRSALPKSKAAAIRDVALLSVVGRQAAGLGDETLAATVRDECAELGVMDTSNFATEVGRLGFRVSGSGAGRSLRPNRNHQEMASERIRTLTGTNGE